VPKDLKVAGDKETFVATLTYNTLDLYGKMEATVPITLRPNQ
jgi:hypothetical protein